MWKLKKNADDYIYMLIKQRQTYRKQTYVWGREQSWDELEV